MHKRSWSVSNFHDYSPFRLCSAFARTAPSAFSYPTATVPHSSFSFPPSPSLTLSLPSLCPVKFYGQDYLFADLSVFYYTRSFHALPYLFSCLLYDIYSYARLYSAPVITEPARRGGRCTKYRGNQRVVGYGRPEERRKALQEAGKKATGDR